MLLVSPGCSRHFWRRQADEDAYRAVSEKQTDPRWHLPRMDLTPDPRSRFYDPYNPDCTPLPPDDPAASRFMQCADGKEGYKHWHKFGVALSVENPHWLEPYQVLLNDPDPVSAHAQVEIPQVTLRDAVDLTYIHSRDYQTEIEDVFLAALDLTLQRFNLNARFVIGPGSSGTGGGLFSGSFPRNGTQTSSLENGIGVTQVLPVGTNIAVELLNTITWSTGGGNGTATQLAWSITQPLLNGAGRKVVLEALTQAERTLLYEVRNLARFRRILFTDVASDYLNILQQIQTIENVENNIRQLERQIEIALAGESRTPSYVVEPLRSRPEKMVIPPDLSSGLSIDEEFGQIRWQGPMTDEQRQQLLSLSGDADYQTAIRQLIASRERTATPLTVQQLLVQLNGLESQLASTRRVLEDLLDAFKFGLGLPTNVRLTADTELLKPFQLIDPSIVAIEDSLNALGFEKGPQLILIPDDPNAEPAINLAAVRDYLTDLQAIRDQLEFDGLQRVKSEFEPIRAILRGDTPDENAGPQRSLFSEQEAQRLAKDLASDERLYEINERAFVRVSSLIDLLIGVLRNPDAEAVFGSLDANNNGAIDAAELPENWQDLPRSAIPTDAVGLTPREVFASLRDAAIGLREDLVEVTQGLQVIQVGLRVDAIALNPFTLPGSDHVPDIEEVIQIGLENRHDLMNARGAVVDARRAVEIAANALQSLLNFSASGTVDPDGGVGANDIDLSLEFKAPVDQVAERNAYREAIINYQRERRNYMAMEDLVKQEIRESWRQLIVGRQRLEIDRQTVRNAALQYDNAALLATAVGQTNSLNILNALNAVLGAQNSLVDNWITYETNRLNIFQDMGIMQVDETGMWIDDFYQRTGSSASSVSPDTADIPDTPALPYLDPPSTELTPAPLILPQPALDEIPSLDFDNNE